MCGVVHLTFAVFCAAIAAIALLVAHDDTVTTHPCVGAGGDAERRSVAAETALAVGDYICTVGGGADVGVDFPLGKSAVNALVDGGADIITVCGEVEQKILALNIGF